MCADNGISAERVEMSSLRKGGRYLRRGDDRTDRAAVPDPFGHRYNVGNHALGLEAPIMRARPAKTALHFVGDA